MGRPLKISKYATESGIIPTTPPFVGAGTPIDQGYPPFADLTNPVPPVGGLNPPWLGVVGGQTGPNTSPSYPVVIVTANIQLPSGAAAGSGAASIIRQKGARKYMVAMNATIAPSAVVVGASYQIVSLGNTNWAAMGAGKNPAVGEVFYCMKVGSGTGTVSLVGTCVLQNLAAPTVGCMSIGYTVGATSNTTYVSKLTNKWLYDFIAGQTGGNSNANNVWNWDDIQQDTRYVADFFSDQGYEVKSGTTGKQNTATQQNQVSLAIVDSQN